jgi:DNA-binding NarL/FixJ family response regulator
MTAISVLLIDANPAFLRIATRLLQEHYSTELQVIGSSSSETDALNQMRVLRPRIIVLGISQDSMRYLHLIPRIREILPNVGVIVLGALDISAYQQAALQAGADAFVARVALSTMLLPTLRRVAGPVGNAATNGAQAARSGPLVDNSPPDDSLQVGI